MRNCQAVRGSQWRSYGIFAFLYQREYGGGAGMKKKKKFSAMLFSQFRVRIKGKSNKKRDCERRIITFLSTGANEAYSFAEKKGKESEFNYLNDEGNKVFFEFIGVMDLLELGVECDKGEVWYDVKEYLTPMERKNSLIPKKNKLINSLK